MKGLIGMLALIGGIAALALTSAPAVSEPLLNEALLAWDTNAACGVNCYDGAIADCPPEGDVGQHRAPPTGDSHETSGGPHWHCVVGFCTVGLVGYPAKHPECTQSFAAILPALRSSLLSEDSHALSSLALEYPEFVEVNSERAAIQLIGCNGTVIGHFPVTPHVLSAMAE